MERGKIHDFYFVMYLAFLHFSHFFWDVKNREITLEPLTIFRTFINMALNVIKLHNCLNVVK